MSESIEQDSIKSEINLNYLQIKILKLLSAVFLINALFMLICPWLMPGIKVSLHMNLSTQVIFLFLTGLLLSACYFLKKRLINKDNWYKVYIVQLCLYEAIVILAILSITAFSDLIIYIFLGLTGLSMLVSHVISLTSAVKKYYQQ